MANSIANLNIRLGFLFDQKSLARVERDLQRTAAKLSRVGSDMSLAISAPLGLIGISAIKAAGDIESFENALKSQLGSAEAAKKELEALRKEALKPGLGFEQAVKGSVSLQAVGLSADEARKTLSEFGNALAIAGKGKAELDGVALALTQISAKGKVSAEEINQIAERLPQIRTLMKQAFGTSDTEALQKLGISSEQFISGIVKQMEGLPRATGGIKNSIENAGDAVSQFLGSIGNEINRAFNITSLSEELSDLLKGISDSFAALDDNTKRMAVQFGVAVVAAGPLLTVFGTMSGVLTRLGGFLSTTTKAFNALNFATREFIVLGVVTALIAIANNLGAFNRELTANEQAQAAVNAVQKEAVASIAREKSEVDTLIAVINSEVSSRDAKGRALEKLKAISPEYFGQLRVENGLVTGLTESYGKYISALLASARAEAAKGKLIEIERQRLELEDSRAEKLKENTSLAKAYGISAEATAKRESELYNKQISILDAKRNALAAVVVQSEQGAVKTANETPAIQANTTATQTATEAAKALAAAKREKKDATEAAKLADEEETAGMERYAKMVREIEQAWLDEAKAEVEARAASVGAVDTSSVAPGGELQLQDPGQAITSLPTKITPAVEAMTALSDSFLTFNSVFSSVAEGVIGNGTVMESVFLAMGSAMQQAAASGASSFADLGNAALGAAAKIIRAYIQQGVAATVAKALGSVPFPFNLAAGAAAGAAASALFTKAIGAIGIKGFAKGTKSAPGGLAVVGEKGPEILNIPKYSQVYTANQTSKMLSGMEGGGVMTLGGEFTVRGTDLVLVLERAQQKNARYR